MANSKTSLSIGLLFFVFLSSQVLAHDEKREANHLTNDNNRGGSTIVANDKKDTWFPPSPIEQTFPNQRATGYNPSKLNNIEPESHEDGYVMKDDSPKPFEIDHRKSAIFRTKTTLGMGNVDKTSYNNLGVEGVGERTIEDET